MLGSRAIANLEGTIVSCDVMGGGLGGPASCNGSANSSDMPCFDGRIRNCRRTTGSACSSTEVANFDATLNQPSQTVLDARFVMERVDDDITCAEVRDYDFPPIPIVP
jgi:hypothetical protein